MFFKAVCSFSQRSVDRFLLRSWTWAPNYSETANHLHWPMKAHLVTGIGWPRLRRRTHGADTPPQLLGLRTALAASVKTSKQYRSKAVILSNITYFSKSCLGLPYRGDLQCADLQDRSGYTVNSVKKHNLLKMYFAHYFSSNQTEAVGVLYYIQMSRSTYLVRVCPVWQCVLKVQCKSPLKLLKTNLSLLY